MEYIFISNKGIIQQQNTNELQKKLNIVPKINYLNNLTLE